MPRRLPFVADGGAAFLLLSVLLTLLGLGLVGSGLAGADSSPTMDAKESRPPTSGVLPNITSPPEVEQLSHEDVARHPGQLLVSRPASVIASIADDPREYLSKMAMLQRHLAGQTSPPDPYQASLNPALYGGYFAADVTPIVRDCSAANPPGELRCRST